VVTHVEGVANLTDYLDNEDDDSSLAASGISSDSAGQSMRRMGPPVIPSIKIIDMMEAAHTSIQRGRGTGVRLGPSTYGLSGMRMSLKAISGNIAEQTADKEEEENEEEKYIDQDDEKEPKAESSLDSGSSTRKRESVSFTPDVSEDDTPRPHFFKPTNKMGMSAAKRL